MLVNVKEYGAIADGKTDNTDILQKIINELQPDGGTVFFPAGEYVMGSMELKSNTTLYLESGAKIMASGCHDLYPAVTENEIEGYVRGTRRALIYAVNQSNIFIKGDGTIDGNGNKWWNKGESDTSRPRTVQFILCRNVVVEGIHIQNSPCWTINPICCNIVRICGVTINNPYNSPNTDGINPESCSNVRISDCCVDVGDDCITIKSGLETDLLQKKYPCENIVISNCTLIHGHGGVVIGSEMSGGIKNVTATNCVFKNTDRGIRIKTRRKRGGTVENIIVSNIVMENVVAGITINTFYNCSVSGNRNELFSLDKLPIDDGVPVIKDIILSNIIMKNVLATGIFVLGLPEMPVKNIKITNTSIEVIGSLTGYYSVLADHIGKSYGDGIQLDNICDTSISQCNIQCKNSKFLITNAKNTFVNSVSAENIND